MSSQPIPRSDVGLRGSLRSTSVRRGGSFRCDSIGARTDSIGADDMVMRENSGRLDSGGGSIKLAVAVERQETRRRLSRELGEFDPDGISDEDEDEDYDEDDEDSGGGLTMSLMDLLEETDRKAGIQGPTYRFHDEEEHEEEEEEDEDDEDDEMGDGAGEVHCSVCMVGHKGAASGVCGHSYCRLCSKELWAQKGHCPCCNNYMLELMELF